MSAFRIIFLMTILGCTSHLIYGQVTDREKILTAMEQQQQCWNNVDIVCFMDYYIQSDSLLFMGKNGITYGWESTLTGYKSRYPDAATMGKLKFEVIDLKPLSTTHYFMTGTYHLTREMGDAGGYFSLVWQKIDEKWLIIADHTSAGE